MMGNTTQQQQPMTTASPASTTASMFHAYIVNETHFALLFKVYPKYYNRDDEKIRISISRNVLRNGWFSRFIRRPSGSGKQKAS